MCTELAKGTSCTICVIWATYFVLNVVEGFNMLSVELLGGEGAHAMEVLVLIPVLPTDGLRRAA